MAKPALMIALQFTDDVEDDTFEDHYTVYYSNQQLIFQHPIDPAATFSLTLSDAEEMMTLAKEPDNSIPSLWKWIDTHNGLLDAIQVSLERLEEEVKDIKRMEDPNDVKDYIDNRLSYQKKMIESLNIVANDIQRQVASFKETHNE